MIIGTTITIITVPAPALPSAQIVPIVPAARTVRGRPDRRIDLPEDSIGHPLLCFPCEGLFLRI
jgi:hypothetical protein